jgi:hypothetical protein
MWENFVKLINSELPLFMDMNINPVFQILGDGRQAFRSCIIVHICPYLIKQTTPLTHIPLIHDTLPIHFEKLMMHFSKADVSHVQKLYHQMHLTIGGISD